MNSAFHQQNTFVLIQTSLSFNLKSPVYASLDVVEFPRAIVVNLAPFLLLLSFFCLGQDLPYKFDFI
jgi:hypothetical protein